MTNLTVGDIFFINGSTNLPVNDSLALTIFQFSTLCEVRSAQGPDVMVIIMGRDASEKIENIQVIPNSTGPNRFSVNITNKMKDLASRDWSILEFQQPSQYIVWGSIGNVTSPAGHEENIQNACNSGFPKTDYFTLYPSHPYLSIDRIYNHVSNEVFFISGTTDIPAGENLTIFINSSQVDPSGHGSYFESSALVEPGGIAGENIWSCNVTPALWTTFTERYEPTHDIKMIGIGDYSASVKNIKFNVNQSQTFNIFANEAPTTSGASKSPTASHATPLNLISILAAIAVIPISRFIRLKKVS